MVAALKVLFYALNDVRIKGYTYIRANLAFVALALPVVTAPAAFSALCRVAHAARIENHEDDLELFWQTFKDNLWRAMPWGLAHGLFAVVNFSNLIQYAGETGAIFVLLRGAWLLMTVIWMGILLYTWFIYYEMKAPDLMGATRNAAVMVLLNPVFTLTLLAAIIILAAMSTVLIASWVLLTWGVIASTGAEAVLNRLAVFKEIHQQTG